MNFSPSQIIAALTALGLYPPVSGGGGAVASVNGATGAVVLDAADVGAVSLSDFTADGIDLSTGFLNLYNGDGDNIYFDGQLREIGIAAQFVYMGALNTYLQLTGGGVALGLPSVLGGSNSITVNDSILTVEAESTRITMDTQDAMPRVTKTGGIAADVPENEPAALIHKQYLDSRLSQNWGKKGFTLFDPQVGDKIPLLVAGSAVTLQNVKHFLPGASDTPSLSFQLYHGLDFSAAGTGVFGGPQNSTNVGVPHSTAAFANAEVPENAILWIEVTAVSGTVPQFHMTATAL